MSSHDNLLKKRFHMNMGRINGLVNLVHSDFDQMKPTGPFKSDGVRADILRTVVVFLHATFEDVLRCHLPKPNKSLSFYSRSDIDKALKKSDIDAKPFQSLYPPLTQMAKRRNRIVHDADLPKRTDVVSETWGIVDEWQLIMWLIAVPAFYYQLRKSVNVANEVEVAMYEKLTKSMQSHVAFGNQLLSFLKVPQEQRITELKKVADTLRITVETLQMRVS